MNWRLLTWKDWFGMLLAAALAAAFLLYYVVHPGVGRPARLDANFGFGADWVCKDPGKGDPICVKKQPSN
jgi:hypothetical protein